MYWLLSRALKNSCLLERCAEELDKNMNYTQLVKRGALLYNEWFMLPKQQHCLNTRRCEITYGSWQSKKADLLKAFELVHAMLHTLRRVWALTAQQNWTCFAFTGAKSGARQAAVPFGDAEGTMNISTVSFVSYWCAWFLTEGTETVITAEKRYLRLHKFKRYIHGEGGIIHLLAINVNPIKKHWE